MKILLISPKVENDFNLFTKGSSSFSFPPYGLQLLAAITPDKHEVKIIDERIGQEIDYNEKVDLVGISVLTTVAPRAYEIARCFEERGIKVVMGGYHVSILPEEALKHCDAICIGEGELTWGQMLEDAENNCLKKVYQSDKLIDLKNLPTPRRDLSPTKKYAPFTLIETSRGCPFKCEFCSSKKFFGDYYRFRPVEDVINEIRQLKEEGKLINNTVNFFDDNIIGNKEHAKQLFSALIPLKIKWLGAVSCNIADDDNLLQLAKKSGCIMVQIGFESISDSSLKDVNKKHGNIEKYKNVIKKLHSVNISVYGFFMFGFDTDDKRIFDETVKFIEENRVENYNLFLLTPFPGTVIYDRLEAEERIFNKNWGYYDLHHTLFQPKLMSAQELQEGFYKAANELSSVRSIIKRVFGARTQIFLSIVCNIANKLLYKKIPTKLTSTKSDTSM